ncbi:MAG: hypothetical protein ACK4PR_12275, partial [Gammaproteobacteria bacterium]
MFAMLFGKKAEEKIDKDKRHVQAIERLMYANGDNRTLVMDLVTSYWNNSLFDRAIIANSILKHILYFLQDNTRNEQGQSILDIISSSNDDDIDSYAATTDSEFETAISKLQRLLKKQYQDYVSTESQPWLQPFELKQSESQNDFWSPVEVFASNPRYVPFPVKTTHVGSEPNSLDSSPDIHVN